MRLKKWNEREKVSEKESEEERQKNKRGGIIRDRK